MNKKTLFCDFDGCISNSILTITTLYNYDFKYYKNFKPISWHDVKSWDFKECNCATKDYTDKYFNQQRFFDNLEFMENAKEVLDKLKDFFDIKIVSMGFSPNLKGKEIWVKDNIPYAEFIGVNFKEHDDKSHIDMSNAIFIEDSVKNLETSNADVKVLYGKEYPWNSNWVDKRYLDWYEIFDYLKDIM